MKSWQILSIVGVAAAMVIGLMMLPDAALVNKDKAAQSAEQNQSGQSAQPIPHQTPGTSTDLAKIDSLRQSLRQTPNLATLDLLGEAFEDALLYDSAAYYAEQFMEQQTRPELIHQVAARYFDAFQYAKSPEKSEQLTETAKAYLAKSIEEDPGQLDNQVRLGVLKALTENPPMQGIFMIRSVLEKDPENLLALKQLGILSIRSGQMAKARERFEKLVAIDPQDYEARLLLGMSCKETGLMEQAKTHLNEIIAHSDRNDLVQSAKEILVSVERETAPPSEAKP